MTVNINEEQAFLNRLTEIIEANLNNGQFGVTKLASKMGISRSYLYRRLKAQTSQSISQFICTVRLKEAMKMLQQKEASAAQIAYEVGRI
jgi:AraC-like DNA-binding protein